MTYRLNACNLSGTFEKSFGLTNFVKGYAAVLGELNAAVEGVNEFPYSSDPEEEYQDWLQDYKLFCKLSHFFDDFNAFINKSIAKRAEHDSKHSVDRRLVDFIRRVESMEIPQQIQDTIVGFLKMQLQKFKFHNSPLQKVIRSSGIKSDEWLVPKVLPQGDLNILHSKPKLYIPNDYLVKLGAALNKEAEIGKDGLNQFDQTRAELLQQLATTLQKLPYIRLGQLLSNSLPEDTDIFYVTDAKLIQLLKDFEAQHGLP